MLSRKERIKEAIKRVGTQSEFARLMGLRGRQCVKEWIARGDVPIRRVPRFCELTGESPAAISSVAAQISKRDE